HFASLFSESVFDHRYLHSFPTRRSSDLSVLQRRSIIMKWQSLGVLVCMALLTHSTIAQTNEVVDEQATSIVDVQADLVRLDLARSEEHTSELQSCENLVCRLLREKKKKR